MTQPTYRSVPDTAGWADLNLFTFVGFGTDSGAGRRAGGENRQRHFEHGVTVAVTGLCPVCAGVDLASCAYHFAPWHDGAAS